MSDLTILRRAHAIESSRIGGLRVAELESARSGLRGLAKHHPIVDWQRKVGGAQDTEGGTRTIIGKGELELTRQGIGWNKQNRG